MSFMFIFPFFFAGCSIIAEDVSDVRFIYKDLRFCPSIQGGDVIRTHRLGLLLPLREIRALILKISKANSPTSLVILTPAEPFGYDATTGNTVIGFAARWSFELSQLGLCEWNQAGRSKCQCLAVRDRLFVRRQRWRYRAAGGIPDAAGRGAGKVSKDQASTLVNRRMPSCG